MKQDPIITINRITMYIWLAGFLLGVIISIYTYFNGNFEQLYLLVALICGLMYGWKRFQLAKFGTRDNS